MGLDDSWLPAPRRPGVPLFCRATAAAPEPRVADLSALLGEIDSLRTTLQADLSLAAAALDAGADQLAVLKIVGPIFVESGDVPSQDLIDAALDTLLNPDFADKADADSIG